MSMVAGVKATEVPDEGRRRSDGRISGATNDRIAAQQSSPDPNSRHLLCAMDFATVIE